MMQLPPLHRLLFLSTLALGACAAPGDETSASIEASDEALGSSEQALQGLPPPGHAIAGEKQFDKALAHTNGRSCGDCHVKSDHRALKPEHVRSLWQTNPNAPLFKAIDADDPNAATLTYNNLQHGLVRVVLNLPPNMDVIDFAGNVITNAERTIEVWRGVPTIENTSLSAKYQFDGRFTTLEQQAIGALESHSELFMPPPSGAINLISNFQRLQFSSPRLIPVAQALAQGTPVSQIPNPDHSPEFVNSLTPAQKRGQEVYEAACTSCHGGATDKEIVNQAAADSLCFLPGPDGNLILDFTDFNGNGVFDPALEFLSLVGRAPPEGCDEFMALGTPLQTMFGQMGIPTLTPIYNRTANLPQYRFRFYTDATRTVQVTDLPPLPRLTPDGQVETDERGVPIFGPVGAPQWFTTDPGRAAITGRPQDFQAFDVPQLRGSIHTGPYFHDNSIETMEEVIDLYSHTILPLTPAVGMFPIHPREGSFLGAESLSAQQKADLLEFMKVF